METETGGCVRSHRLLVVMNLLFGVLLNKPLEGHCPYYGRPSRNERRVRMGDEDWEKDGAEYISTISGYRLLPFRVHRPYG